MKRLKRQQIIWIKIMKLDWGGSELSACSQWMGNEIPWENHEYFCWRVNKGFMAWLEPPEFWMMCVGTVPDDEFDDDGCAHANTSIALIQFEIYQRNNTKKNYIQNRDIERAKDREKERERQWSAKKLCVLENVYQANEFCCFSMYFVVISSSSQFKCVTHFTCGITSWEKWGKEPHWFKRNASE